MSEALREFGAEGGDVVFLDPKTGELLALVSRTAHGTASTASVFTGVFEPGSTAKPFTAAALLALGRVKDRDAVSGEGGEWVFETSGGHKRRISDTHKVDGQLTLAQAIQVSSNIAMAKFSTRLRPEEHYDAIRSFGFGGRPASSSPRRPRAYCGVRTRGARGTMGRARRWGTVSRSRRCSWLRHTARWPTTAC